MKSLCLSLVCFGSTWTPLFGQEAPQPGDCVRVRSHNVQGVPLHREARNSFTGDRVTNGAVVKAIEVADDGRWFRIDHLGQSRWINSKYIEETVACDALPSPGDGERGGRTFESWSGSLGGEPPLGPARRDADTSARG